MITCGWAALRGLLCRDSGHGIRQMGRNTVPKLFKTTNWPNGELVKMISHPFFSDIDNFILLEEKFSNILCVKQFCSFSRIFLIVLDFIVFIRFYFQFTFRHIDSFNY